ncbi:MAG: VOC family protein [Betaproteobacteria bacterium]|nr:VOC family protein [Betaproteobacteria bacterium]
MAKIRHIAIFSDDPQKLADYYVDVFDMKITGISNGGKAVWMTDGYMDIALLPRSNELAPQGVHHFGITLEANEKEKVYARLKATDTWMMKPPPGRPYVEEAAKDADGNKFDISTSKIEASDGHVKLKDLERVEEKADA